MTCSGEFQICSGAYFHGGKGKTGLRTEAETAVPHEAVPSAVPGG